MIPETEVKREGEWAPCCQSSDFQSQAFLGEFSKSSFWELEYEYTLLMVKLPISDRHLRVIKSPIEILGQFLV